MRHRRAGVKLHRTVSHRDAMFRNMVTSLFKHDRIRTTDVKAKELRRWADHIITLAKRGDLHARRQALSIIMEKNVVHKLFEEADERFGKVAGGYTRLAKVGMRPGDAAPMTLIELISPVKKEKKESGDKRGKKAEKADVSPEKKTETTPQTKVEEKEEKPVAETKSQQDTVAVSGEKAPEETPEASPESDK